MLCCSMLSQRAVLRRRAALLKAEEEAIEGMCARIAAFKPDLVITEKVRVWRWHLWQWHTTLAHAHTHTCTHAPRCMAQGLSDLAAHFLTKRDIT